MSDANLLTFHGVLNVCYEELHIVFSLKLGFPELLIPLQDLVPSHLRVHHFWQNVVLYGLWVREPKDQQAVPEAIYDVLDFTSVEEVDLELREAITNLSWLLRHSRKGMG